MLSKNEKEKIIVDMSRAISQPGYVAVRNRLAGLS
jgi:hypothetical protein